MLRSKPQDLPSPACAVLDEILRLRIALLAEDQTLCAEQIARETAGEKPVDEPAPDAVSQLRDELLNGFAAAPAIAPPVRSLKQIVDRRAAIAQAVETLQSRETVAQHIPKFWRLRQPQSSSAYQSQRKPAGCGLRFWPISATNRH